MVTPPETFTDVLSTLCIVCREGEKKERAEGLILHFYQYPHHPQQAWGSAGMQGSWVRRRNTMIFAKNKMPKSRTKPNIT